MDIIMQPVAFVRNNRTGTSDDYWGGILSEIVLADGIPDEAFEGIDAFSHVEIIFHFNQSDPAAIVYSGHPRGNTAWPHVGIFAQRKKDRPNAIGLTIAELVKKEGRSLFVRKLDAIDGTPILDIKPVLREFLPKGAIQQPAWATELMQQYWL